jgi:hypothetical protein
MIIISELKKKASTRQLVRFHLTEVKAASNLVTWSRLVRVIAWNALLSTNNNNFAQKNVQAIQTTAPQEG